MKESSPSATAWRVAMHRAAHQIMDDPKVFDDPLALRMVGMEDVSAQELDPQRLEEKAVELRLRAFLAARSRITEDEVNASVNRGARQYVILGAGLDTFAYRNLYPEDVLHVYEVDHPNTQAWKQSRLKELGISIPQTLTFCPVDFEIETLEEALRKTEFDTTKPTFFSWLGVTPYIKSESVFATLRLVASMPVGSGIVFDYMTSPEMLNPTARKVLDGLAQYVAAAGEPFQSFFDPSSLKESLLAMGFGHIEDLDPEELNGRYFQGRSDGLRVGSLSHVMNARV